MSVVVYSKVPCGGCGIVKQILDNADVPYTEKRIDLDESAMKELQDLGMMGVPVVKAEGIEPFSGVNMTGIEAIVAKYGK